MGCSNLTTKMKAKKIGFKNGPDLYKLLQLYYYMMLQADIAGISLKLQPGKFLIIYQKLQHQKPWKVH